MRARLFIALGALVTVGWAVPNAGTAPFIVQATPPANRAQGSMPLAARLRVSRDRGLLVKAWVKGKGPYVFAVDTGAGMNVITQRVVDAAQLPTRTTQPTDIAGLTGVKTRTSREALFDLALGAPSNTIRSQSAVVVPTLAPDIDGILDPTEVYAPYGYSIDMLNQRIEAVDTALSAQKSLNGEGATVPWLRFDDSPRPFVRLGDGRVALVDTGSSFGLAVNGRNAVVRNRQDRKNEGGLDIGGGTINSQRVAPTTVSIGSLVLRGVPTDILFGIEDDAPVILGRDFLYPFKITFDPQRRLIEFVTSRKS